MSLDELADAIVFNRQVAYFLIGLMILQLLADAVVFAMSITILRRATVYLDIAAKHGKESDLRTTRVERELEANKQSGVLPPSIVPAAARIKGCGPALSVIVGVLLLAGWEQNRAGAAERMRADGAASAVAWMDEQADSPLSGS